MGSGYGGVVLVGACSGANAVGRLTGDEERVMAEGRERSNEVNVADSLAKVADAGAR